jgi:hypothetical protein
MISKNSKIYIAGQRGMVGSAIWRTLTQKGYTNLIGQTSQGLDKVITCTKSVYKLRIDFEVCTRRPTILPPNRSRFTHRRPHQIQNTAGLGA